MDYQPQDQPILDPVMAKKEKKRIAKEERESEERQIKKRRKLKKLSRWLIIIIILASLTGWYAYSQSQPGELDDFAVCLTDKGAIFYGAFWCSHCQNQKATFGKSAKLLNYIECSTPDGRGQTSECDAAGIQGYPTWEFQDGSRQSGELSLETLSSQTNCPLPDNF